MNRISKEELNKMPQEIRDNIKGTLSAYDRVTIIWENKALHVYTGSCLQREYSNDYLVIGDVYADDIYNSDEKIVNYIESFLAYPPEYSGEDDWDMINKLKDLRQNYQIGKIALDEKGNAYLKEIIDMEDMK